MDVLNERLRRLLHVVQKEDITFKELVNASTNMLNMDLDRNDPEVEFVLSTIDEIKWVKFKTKAKKKYGTQYDAIKETLGTYLAEASKNFDLSNNKVLNKVKIGGDMIGGRALIDIYISYKNSRNEVCSFSAYQGLGSDPIKWRICTYATGQSKQDRVCQEFEYTDESSAHELYRAKLLGLLNG